MNQVNSINNLLEVGEIYNSIMKRKILSDYINIYKYKRNNVCFEYENKYKLIKENNNIFFEHFGEYNIKIKILLHDSESLIRYLLVI